MPALPPTLPRALKPVDPASTFQSMKYPVRLRSSVAIRQTPLEHLGVHERSPFVADQVSVRPRGTRLWLKTDSFRRMHVSRVLVS